jgi:hypothetical protein
LKNSGCFISLVVLLCEHCCIAARGKLSIAVATDATLSWNYPHLSPGWTNGLMWTLQQVINSMVRLGASCDWIMQDSTCLDVKAVATDATLSWNYPHLSPGWTNGLMWTLQQVINSMVRLGASCDWIMQDSTCLDVNLITILMEPTIDIWGATIMYSHKKLEQNFCSYILLWQYHIVRLT